MGYVPPAMAERIAEERPFYEVKFSCEYDSDTGKLSYIAMDSE